MVWYILFIIFATFAMLPLPLRWSLVAATVAAVVHLACFTAMQKMSPTAAYAVSLHVIYK